MEEFDSKCNPMNKVLVLFSLPLLFSGSLSATHLIGGEITWSCDTSGKYVFQVKLYRDCSGAPGPASSTLCSDGPVSSIYCAFVSHQDISPVCNPAGPSYNCAGIGGSSTGAFEELIYQSAPVVLNGVPPAAGWVFWWSN